MAYAGGPANFHEEMEIAIPVPWGIIAGKAWNDTNGIRVLFVHGIQDNAGSFDTLIALLPDSYYCVAIDLPGHGKSSHFPKGLPLKTIDCSIAVERVVDFLGWEKFVFIGHSMGAHVGFFFSALFNERVEKFVALDSVFVGHPADYCVENVVRSYRSLKDIEERVEFGKPPEYPYKGAIQRLMESRPDLISEKAAKTLAKRSLVKYGNGFRFSMDQRLKVDQRQFFSPDQALALFERIKCPILRIVTTETLRVHPDVKHFEPITAMFKKNLGESYREHVIEGYHSVHMDYPERVRGLIMNFLANTKSQL